MQYSPKSSACISPIHRNFWKKLQEAAVTGNGELMRASAHSLKSASANLGASRLAELCEELEDFGRNDNAMGSLASLGIVEFEFEAVCNALSQELDDKAA
ncbi:MAG: Hpt domain-containing protein [Pseudomonadota bacterium]|nr:Hpt domain-containing protein [Pseudomonadota bacterium]